MCRQNSTTNNLFNVGDRVRIAKEPHEGTSYPEQEAIVIDKPTVGAPYRVEPIGVKNPVSEVHLEQDLTLVAKRTRDEVMASLKVGDQVKILIEDDNDEDRVGTVGKLIEIDSDDLPFYVEFEDGDRSYYHWFAVEKHVETPAAAPAAAPASIIGKTGDQIQLQVGDRVRISEDHGIKYGSGYRGKLATITKDKSNKGTWGQTLEVDAYHIGDIEGASSSVKEHHVPSSLTLVSRPGYVEPIAAPATPVEVPKVATTKRLNRSTAQSLLLNLLDMQQELNTVENVDTKDQELINALAENLNKALTTLR